MKLALLKGNRFNPWHMQVYGRMQGVELTAFRADSEIQRHFEGRDDGSVQCVYEPIRFESESWNPVTRLGSRLREKFQGQVPRMLPFHKRLEAFDLIQTWELFTDWTREALDAKRLYGVPVSVMVWDTIPFHHERNAHRAVTIQRAIEEADVFIVHTERSKRTLELEGVDSARIHLAPPGVDAHRFSPGPPNRSSFEIEDDEFVILFVGWLLPRKGIDYLLMALRLLVDDRILARHKFRLLVVGSGPGQDRVDALIDRLRLKDHVSFAGSMPYDRMADAYRSADLFVLPSIPEPDWQEQFGMALLEAMATGLPVVTTHSGAIPEIAGDAARLCPPADFVALYESIRTLTMTEQRRESLGKSALKRVRDNYTLDAAAAALTNIYNEVLSGGGREARPAAG